MHNIYVVQLDEHIRRSSQQLCSQRGQPPAVAAKIQSLSTRLLRFHCRHATAEPTACTATAALLIASECVLGVATSEVLVQQLGTGVSFWRVRDKHLMQLRQGLQSVCAALGCEAMQPLLDRYEMMLDVDECSVVADAVPTQTARANKLHCDICAST